MGGIWPWAGAGGRCGRGWCGWALTNNSQPTTNKQTNTQTHKQTKQTTEQTNTHTNKQTNRETNNNQQQQQHKTTTTTITTTTTATTQCFNAYPSICPPRGRIDKHVWGDQTRPDQTRPDHTHGHMDGQALDQTRPVSISTPGETRRDQTRPGAGFNTWHGSRDGRGPGALGHMQDPLRLDVGPWLYRDLMNSRFPVLGLAGCPRPAGQGPTLAPKLPGHCGDISSQGGPDQTKPDQTIPHPRAHGRPSTRPDQTRLHPQTHGQPSTTPNQTRPDQTTPTGTRDAKQ